MNMLPSDRLLRLEKMILFIVRLLRRLKRSTKCSKSHVTLYVELSFPWCLSATRSWPGLAIVEGERVARTGGRRGRIEGRKVIRLQQGGGWPEVSRWSRGCCRGSNKLPPETSFHVTTLTSLYGYPGQPCNLINCHKRTTMLPETSRELERISWLSNFFARLSLLIRH